MHLHLLVLAASSHASLNAALGLASWPVILAAFCGFLATQATTVLAHRNAPQWLKSGINLALVTLAGVLISLQVVPGSNWKDTVGLIIPAWLTSLATHYSGLTQLLSHLTGDVGVGASLAPIVPVQVSQNAANAASSLTAVQAGTLAPAGDPTFPEDGTVGTTAPKTKRATRRKT